ncbi:MAG: Rrf2 family transcriptional regulator [Bacteroidia bacterium]|nr:Rrf2 family transcriptional regulator [Bacteroidia bacterium]
MLSQTCKIAIKSVLYLASKHGGGNKISIKQISKFIGASEHTAGKVLQILVKQKIIQSTKGPSGGFYITPLQYSKSLMVIVDAIDGKHVFNECGLGLSKCSSTHPCPIHFEYKKSRDIFEKLFSEKSILEHCDTINNDKSYLFG